MSVKVLVTGASGFVGGYVILQLLAKGYDVRGTLRNPASSGDRVRRRLVAAAGEDPGARLSFVQADLTSEQGWADAVAGCSFVHHVASPFPAQQPKTDDELVVPARDGALRVVRAAAAAGVKRVVLTSSTAAVSVGNRPSAGDFVFTEADWSDPASPQNTPYTRSKTIAEREARAAAKAAGIEFVSVNPSAILGPVLDDDLSTSIELVRRPLAGEIPGAPRLGFPVVDVRDLADMHLSAMTTPGIDGGRFIASGGFLWMKDIAEILRRRYPDRAARIKANAVPDFVMHALALFDPVLREPARNLGKKRTFDTTLARKTFGWTPRSDEQAVIDTAESLIRLGIA